MYKVKEVVNYLLNLYPLELGSSFDMGKIGLQFGNPDDDVKKVMVCLDCTNEVLDQAINTGCNMIISHHPFMFNPIINCYYNSMMGQKLMKVFNNKLNIFAMHTNFDSGNDGMNDLLCKMIGLKNIVSCTPDAMPDSILRFGDIDSLTLEELALKVKKSFNEPMVKVIGKMDKKITKVGVIGGAGSFEWMKAKALGIDCLITGEYRHNNMVEANELGYSLIEVSHYVESSCKTYIKDLLNKNFNELEVVLAEEQIPYKIL